MPAARAQQADTLGNLNDEFSGAALQGWKWFHEAENFPDKRKSVTLSNGSLNLQPGASGWYADYQAPFMYREVSGDFDVRTRIRVSGTGSELPQSEWSLAGLMVREPKRSNSSNWTERTENWMFITTGIAEPKGIPVFEVKTTNNSLSNLKLRPAKAGWVELRIVRIQASFLLMYRYEGEEWTLLERFYRPLLPHRLQVGLNAYSGWNNIPMNEKQDPRVMNATVSQAAADLVLEADYIRFKRPAVNREKLLGIFKSEHRIPYYTPGNILTDFGVSNQQVLEIVGN